MYFTSTLQYSTAASEITSEHIIYTESAISNIHTSSVSSLQHVSSTHVPDFTIENPQDDLWIMPPGWFIPCVTLSLIQLVTGIFSNILLIITICSSASLRTPPNAYLVNICCNNCALCLCMVISFTSALLSTDVVDHVTPSAFGKVQMFFLVMCFLQYCSVFASIGFYRCKTVKNPALSTKTRNKMIIKSLVFGWLVSVIFALSVSISYRSTTSVLSWNPFRKYFHQTELKGMGDLNAQQLALFYILLFVIILYCVIIIRSYHYIVKTLLKSSTVTKNKVSPWTRSSSVSSEGNDLMLTTQRSYKPDMDESLEVAEESSKGPFSISNGNVLIDNFVVHYQKKQHSASLDDAFALENPMKAQALKEFPPANKRHLTSQLSNVSQGSIKSLRRASDFTDISPGAELNRFQSIKNRKALHNQTLRRDRINLGSATKNSFIMLATFVICSLPLFVCSIPGVLNENSLEHMSRPLIVCQLIYYFNAPAYPIWYLVFSKRVRRCVIRLYDNILLKLYLR